mmetsp:Transcript_1989/g.7610  ORF Transcript_1989/g.7610 Transcript_1989/m.7610 type:complete len:252 (+) Transcript_1989:11419-12174(+)
MGRLPPDVRPRRFRRRRCVPGVDCLCGGTAAGRIAGDAGLAPVCCPGRAFQFAGRCARRPSPLLPRPSVLLRVRCTLRGLLALRRRGRRGRAGAAAEGEQPGGRPESSPARRAGPWRALLRAAAGAPPLPCAARQHRRRPRQCAGGGLRRGGRIQGGGGGCRVARGATGACRLVGLLLSFLQVLERLHRGLCAPSRRRPALECGGRSSTLLDFRLVLDPGILGRCAAAVRMRGRDAARGPPAGDPGAGRGA